jgi:hypothetical protein
MPSDQLAQHFATDFRQESVAGNDAHKKKGHKIGQSKARTNKPKNGKNMAKKWKKGKNITS